MPSHLVYNMYISEELKKENISEYLLYMWQVEDIIRAFNFNIDEIESKYIPQFKLDEEKSTKMKEWYEGLIQMMHEEGIEKSGHLQVNNAIIILLMDLHLQVLKSPKFAVYSALYYKALPYIVEIRNKSNGQDKCEIENCFDVLYGILLLKAQGKKISAETEVAIDQISKLLALLSEYYAKDKKQELELE